VVVTDQVDRVFDGAGDVGGGEPQAAVSQKPIPTTLPRRDAAELLSERLRALSQVPRTPVWEATSGRAMARTSAMVAGEEGAGRRRCPALHLRTSVRPRSVRLPGHACAEPAKALS
jgi:hypothetical protein